MGRGIFSKLLNNLEAAGEKAADTRREGYGLKYKLIDAIKSGLSVFFFQPANCCSISVGFSACNEREEKTQ